MDWQSSRTNYGLVQQAAEEEMDEGEEDFYGMNANSNRNHSESYAVPGASDKPVNGTPNTNPISGKVPLDKTFESSEQTTPSAEQRKAENQKKAADLRAKLIAQRQNTPVKGPSRSNTPSKSVAAPQEQPKSDTQYRNTQTEQHDSSSDMFGLESLLAEGKAAAEAKMKQYASEQTQLASNKGSTVVQATSTSPGKGEAMTAAKSGYQLDSTPNQTLPTNLADDYYADLAIWLEVTGYHDVQYRNSKLSTYKERKALEEEAARIAERLEKLRQAEQTEIASIRSATTHPTAQLQPPPLPNTMPNGSVAAQTPVNKPITPAPTTNGVKRTHSPEPAVSEKAIRRHEEPINFRIRGVNETPEARPGASQAHSPPSTGLERRISYPEARRRSDDNFNRSGFMKSEPRDPSLERRQAFYKRDGVSATPASNYNRDNRFDRTDYSSYVPGRPLEHRDRPGRAGPERASTASNYREYPPQYRGSAGLELRKGGVRYFMIKSWNSENVQNAMTDGLWATQQKNEKLLTEAFRTSRHVILLFSVNKSVAFQGYALMTSAPDPNLPKPPFCAKLNWGTSPAFTLRWLATTSVHFRFVGHLKNNLNLDDHGQPMAVLVGKDGQEISAEAGMGVVSILDEADEIGERKQSH